MQMQHKKVPFLHDEGNKSPARENNANSVDPDQTSHSATSDLGLHCLPITHHGLHTPLTETLDAVVYTDELRQTAVRLCRCES